MNDNILVADIEGYAAIFGEADLNGDILEPGAFTKTLRSKKGDTAPIRMLFHHAPETPVGSWVEFTEDSRGLFARGQLLLSSSHAREAYALVAGGAMDGLSIGYQTVRARKSRGGGRHILEADLWEVSIVTFPMAPRARITGIGDPRPQHQLNSDGIQSPGTPLKVRPPSRSNFRRASSPSPIAAHEARQFADVLRQAASTFSVQGVNR